jgi:hypothetical protein
MSAYQSTPLTAEMIASIAQMDEKAVCGPLTRVREVWRVRGKDTAIQDAHFVFIGDRERQPYCSRCGYDCASVAAVENERVRRQAVAQ